MITQSSKAVRLHFHSAPSVSAILTLLLLLNIPPDSTRAISGVPEAPADTAPDSTDARDPRGRTLTKTKSGPWGTIEYYNFYLEAPEHLVSKFRMPSTITRWAFPIARSPELPDLLAECGVSAESVQSLMQPRRIVKDRDSVFLFPSRDTIEGLSTDSRTKLYALLTKYPLNSFHAFPVLFVGVTVDEWAEDSGMPESAVAKIKQLAYMRGKTLAFSDVPYLLSLATSDSQARTIFHKLTRVRTLLARLAISDHEDIPSLVDYWNSGLGLRHKEIGPIIAAARRVKGVDHLDLLHVLPPLPSKLLYTYVDPEQATLGRFPDCHWTSLNFFNYEPENIYLDTRLAASAVMENFTPVEPPFRYADVLMFLDANEHAVHSCTYLAADLVFTKNGANITTPWILMQLEDVKKIYSEEEGVVRVQGYRHKPITNP